ncbi:MAG: hydrolase [Chitinophagaceae bacterium]|nr:MAG: hydrolase [Chitinophagaceae bacterium]
MADLNLNRNTFGDEKNKGNLLTREVAFALLDDWVKNDRLKLHMFQVGGLMKAWAISSEQDDETLAWKWEMSGLLHDADWDQWPDQHCKKIIEYLESLNIDPEVLNAIASHGHIHFGVEPKTNMDKMLYAFDELSGLIHAYSLIRPTGYDGMDSKGVLKRLKEKTFASGVSRDDIQDACARAEITLEDLIRFIIQHQPSIGLN